MGSSGVIYAVIVVLWAVVLVPMWLRRHDEVSESRSVDRFQGAMRTLSRRGGWGGDREVVMPPRPEGHLVPDGARPIDTSPSARRRRALLVLLSVCLAAAVAALTGVLHAWVAVLVALVVFGFAARGRVVAQREAQRQVAARRARAAAARRRRDARVEAELAQVRRSAVRAGLAQAAPAAGTVAADVAADVAATDVAPDVASQPLYDAVAERVWEPIAVPLPTYVTAPKAPRSVRIIDLSQPGAWTSGRLPEPAEGDAAEAPAARDDSIVTGELLVERRAVND